MDAQPVVFVMFAGGRPTAALQRTTALAARFGAPLHVVCVSHDADEAEVALGYGDKAWLDDLVPRAIVRRDHQTSGQLIHEAIRYANDHDPRLVVLPSDEGHSGWCVTAIASATHVPVLVACPATHGDIVIAATDLHDGRFPVLRQAAEMLDHADTILVGLHNVAAGSSESNVHRRVTELAVALDPLTLTAEAVVASDVDPATALLAAADERDADLIVVGAPPRGWLDSVLRPCVASQVVAGANRSVLVTPIWDDGLATLPG